MNCNYLFKNAWVATIRFVGDTQKTCGPELMEFTIQPRSQNEHP